MLAKHLDQIILADVQRHGDDLALGNGHIIDPQPAQGAQTRCWRRAVAGWTVPPSASGMRGEGGKKSARKSRVRRSRPAVVLGHAPAARPAPRLTRRCYCPSVLCPKNTRRAGARSIWVRKAHGRKYPHLKTFHQSGICVIDVIIAQKMQHGMHHQMGHMIGERLALFGRLARRRCHRRWRCRQDSPGRHRHRARAGPAASRRRPRRGLRTAS